MWYVADSIWTIGDVCTSGLHREYRRPQRAAIPQHGRRVAAAASHTAVRAHTVQLTANTQRWYLSLPVSPRTHPTYGKCRSRLTQIELNYPFVSFTGTLSTLTAKRRNKCSPPSGVYCSAPRSWIALQTFECTSELSVIITFICTLIQRSLETEILNHMSVNPNWRKFKILVFAMF